MKKILMIFKKFLKRLQGAGYETKFPRFEFKKWSDRR